MMRSRFKNRSAWLKKTSTFQKLPGSLDYPHLRSAKKDLIFELMTHLHYTRMQSAGLGEKMIPNMENPNVS